MFEPASYNTDNAQEYYKRAIWDDAENPIRTRRAIIRSRDFDDLDEEESE